MAIGNRIKQLRELRGWTLEDLSSRSGVEVGTISALERRDSRRSQFFGALAKAFGMTFQELAEGQPQPDTRFEDEVEASISRSMKARDKWMLEAESMLRNMTPIQRAQMVAHMRAFKKFVDR